MSPMISERDLRNGFITIAVFIFLSGLGTYALFSWLLSEEPEPQTSSISTSLEDRCDFVVKSNGGDFHISEPNAGTYKYELYATPDGYVEVWKCN